MDFEDTLLYGIQKIPGETPGEKFKYINIIAKEVAENKGNSANFPEPLKPLLNVEVAKIVNKTDTILEALRTSDALLCKRALQLPNLFPDENSPLLQWDYFNDQLFSRISYSTRFRLIKKLSQDLQNKNPKYAETFYQEISKLYGKKQASPLLLACSEIFLHKVVKETGVKIDGQYVKKLFKKYPNFVISYPYLYTKIIPELVNEYFDLFVECCNNFKNNLSFKLGKHRTKIFLSKGTQLLIENPKTYFNVLSLKTISKRLSLEDFSRVMSELVPKNVDSIWYYRIRSKLEHFSNEKKVSITLLTFKKAYNMNLLDYPELIVPELLKILPTNDRYRIARLKLEKDNDWNFFPRFENSWRVYLPPTEIFDEVKIELAREYDHTRRCELMELLIYCCDINEDKDALLKILKYTLRRHKNNRGILLSVLTQIKFTFENTNLDDVHWTVIMRIIKQLVFIFGKTASYDGFAYMQDVIKKGIRFKFTRNLNADEYLKLFLIFNRDAHRDEAFDIFEMDLHLQKLCLEKFMNLLEPCFNTYEIDGTNIVGCLLHALIRYNKKIKPEQKDIENETLYINIGDHPMFIQYIESIVLLSDNEKKEKFLIYLNGYTRQYNVNLFQKWFPNENIDVSDTYECLYFIFRGRKEARMLKTNYNEIIDRCDEFHSFVLTNIQSKIYWNKRMKIFVKLLCWYKDLPIQFLNASMLKLKNGHSFSTLKILGILLDGSKYQELIEPLIPLTPKLNLDDQESVRTHLQVEKCVEGMKWTNPPTSLDIFERLLGSDFLPMCEQSLFSMICRFPTATVINFAANSIQERVAVSKMMIIIMCIVGSREDIRKTFENLLKSKIHSSIHGLIFKKALTLFVREPTEGTWKILQKCLEKSNIEDQKLLQVMANFELISQKYLGAYAENVLDIFENIQMEGSPNLSKELVNKVLGQLNGNSAKVLPAKFQKKLIQKYLFDRVFDDENPSLDIKFLFDVYLSNDEDHSISEKMLFISDFLEKLIDEYFDELIKDKDNFFCYRCNKFIKDLVNSFISWSGNRPVNIVIVNCLLGLFESKIKPWQDVESFLQLRWIEEFDKQLYPESFGLIFGQKVNRWIIEFGMDYVPKIVEFVKKFLIRIYGNNSDILCRCVQGLLEVKSSNSYICAALLMRNLDKNDNRYSSIIEELNQLEIPSVLSLTYYKLYF